MSIGQRIKQSRLAADYTQEKLAKKVGVSQQTIASWEAGESRPNRRKHFVICDVLGLSPDWLQRGVGDQYAAPFRSEVGHLEQAKERLRLAIAMRSWDEVEGAYRAYSEATDNLTKQAVTMRR